MIDTDISKNSKTQFFDFLSVGFRDDIINILLGNDFIEVGNCSSSKKWLNTFITESEIGESLQ
jgi:hypothetical protein